MSTLLRAMLDRAQIWRMSDPGDWIEGERLLDELAGPYFACMRLPEGSTADQRTGRERFTARLLAAPDAEILPGDKLIIDSDPDVEWRVAATPTALRRRRRVVALEVRLTRIED